MGRALAGLPRRNMSPANQMFVERQLSGGDDQGGVWGTFTNKNEQKIKIAT